MDFDTEIYKLSSRFAADYPQAQYPELLLKPGRPYNCLLIETQDDYFICIPFRSQIHHKNAYMFKNSLRSRQSCSGLDYSKIVIIKDSDYLDSGVVVDQDEYNEAMQNMQRIVREASDYVGMYINHKKGTKILHPKEYDRRYKFSTLPYFDNIIL